MRYMMTISMEFETESALPEISASGTMDEMQSVIDGLPQPPQDIDETKATASVILKKVF